MAEDRYATLLNSLDAEQLSYSGTFEEALAVADRRRHRRLAPAEAA